VHDGQYVLPESHPLTPSITVVACGACGFCFNDTPSSQQDYDRYYGEMSKYADPRVSTGAGASAEDRERLERTADQIGVFSGRTSDRILDIGCGGGGLLDCLAARGYAALHGMDPSPACASLVGERGHRGVTGTLSRCDIAPGSFDGVLLSHVMEHVLDLRAALDAVANLIAPGGWVYVEVPDATRYEECLVAPFQDFNLEHINHFSSQSLNHLLATRGWAVVEAGSKSLALPGGKRYPAVWTFAMRSRGASPGKDSVTRPSLARYVEQSERELAGIVESLASRLEGNEPVYVWGVGQLAMRLLGSSCLATTDIVAFVDSNPIHHGKLLRGRPVISPQQLAEAETGPRHPIVVGSLVNQGSIEASIRGQGIVNPLIHLKPESCRS
jgi:SAM-dependent methyltransferase